MFVILKQVHEKEMEILSNSEKLKTDYEKRIRSVQKEIDRCDEYKDKVHDLELKLKSLLLFLIGF